MFNRQSVFFGGDTRSTNIKVNAVSGGIVKNHANSYFMRFNLKSEMAGRLLSPDPYRNIKKPYEEQSDFERRSHKTAYTKLSVEVLQMVVVGDMEVIAECIDIKDDTNREG